MQHDGVCAGYCEGRERGSLLGWKMCIRDRMYTVYTWKIYGAPNGYATIVVLISFMFSVLFVIVGIIGEYIAILFAEIKDRPVYIVKDTANIKKNRSKDTDGQDVR